MVQFSSPDGRDAGRSAELTDEAVSSLLLQHLADVAHAADGELVVVEFVSGSGSGVHDVVPLLLLILALGFSRGALGSGVMLSHTTRQGERVSVVVVVELLNEWELVKFLHLVYSKLK